VKLTPTATIATALLTVAACGNPTHSASHLNAQQVVTQLAQHIPTVTPSGVYTADTDPNHLLGRPGGYLSKASFTDTRISSPSLAGDPAGAVERGGSVETYADAAEARNRMVYIQGIAKSNPMFGEYDYTAGPSLIRVSRLLTPQQAADYQSAAQRITAG
jgi:hypothetical protein